jgi:hypothetical protein
MCGQVWADGAQVDYRGNALNPHAEITYPAVPLWLGGERLTSGLHLWFTEKPVLLPLSKENRLDPESAYLYFVCTPKLIFKGYNYSS